MQAASHSTEPAGSEPRPTSPARSGSTRARDDGAEAFASLISALRTGSGVNLLTPRSRAAVSQAFAARGTGDARERRIEQMTSDAREGVRQAGARKAGVSDLPGTQNLSGRAQRLAAQEHAAADPRALRTPHPTPAVTGLHESKPTMQQADGSGGSGLQVDYRPAGASFQGSAPPAQQPRIAGSEIPGRADNVAAPRSGADSPALGAIGNPSPGPIPTAAPRAVIGAAVAQPSDATVARQFAQLLNSRFQALDGLRSGSPVVLARGETRAASAGAAGAAGKAVTAPAQAADSPDPARVAFEKLVRAIRLNIGSRQSSATIRLHPPELGRVRVDVKMADSHVDLRVEVETPAARKIMASRLEALRAALTDHGLIPERVDLVDQAPGRQAGTVAHGAHPDAASEQAGPFNGQSGGGDRAATWDEDGTYGFGEEAEQDDKTLVTVLDARLDIHI